MNKDSLIDGWLLLLAAVVPVSIAATSLLYFPLIGLYILLGAWTFRRWPPHWGGVEKAFLCFWIISLLSAVFGMNPWISRIRLGKDLYILILVLLGAYLAKTNRNSQLTKVFMVSAILTAAFGIVQRIIGVDQTTNAGGSFFYLPPWLAHAPRSLVDHLSMVHGRSVGTRAHPLTYAECLLFPLGYTLSVLAIQREFSWKWALGQFLVLLALVSTKSRGPWIAASAMVFVVCLLHRDITFYKRLALIYLPVALCFFAPSMRARAFSITDNKYDSNSERLEMWQAGRRMIKDHPLLGVGTGTMTEVSGGYQLPARRREGPWGHLHNTYINMAAERGLLGLAAFLLFILALARELWQGYQESNAVRQNAVTTNDVSQNAVEESQIINLTGLLSLLGWLVAGLTETVAHDSNVLMMFYFVMGLSLAASRGLLKNL